MSLFEFVVLLAGYFTLAYIIGKVRTLFYGEPPGELDDDPSGNDNINRKFTDYM